MKIVQESAKNELCSHVRKFEVGSSLFHWHNKYEICQLISGPCRFLVDGRLIEADAGDIIAVDEQIVHRFLVDREDTYIRIVQFPLGIVLNTGASVTPIRPHITHAEISAVPDLAQTLERLFAMTDREARAQYARDNPFFCGLCAAVYFLLMRSFPPDKASAPLKNDRMLFFRITEYVNGHFREDINVSTVAASLYIPRGRLASLFEKYAGIGLNAYIRALRISLANQLMAGGQSMTEAALESGFQSIRTFNNAYRAQMGMTPTEYLRKNTEK